MTGLTRTAIIDAEVVEMGRRATALSDDTAERAVLGAVLLDAARVIPLDARLLLRGEDPAASWPERRAWRALARAQGWPVVDTSGTPAETLAALLARLPPEVTQ